MRFERLDAPTGIDLVRESNPPCRILHREFPLGALEEIVPCAQLH